MPAVELYRWSDLEWCVAYSSGLQRLHRLGVAVDLELLLPTQLFARLRALPPARIDAILDDPLTYAHVYSTSPELVLDDHIATAIDGAPSATHREVRPGVEVTADGKLYLQAGTQLVRPEETRASTQDEQQIAFARLAEAYDLLEALSPCAHHLVMVMKRRLSLRSATLAGCFFGSNRATVGALHFTNLHLEQASPTTIVTSLVHEAIHDSLFVLERSHPLIVEDPPVVRPHPASLLQVAHGATARGQDETPMVRSPWTGRALPLGTYVHAVFVWFGLLNLLELDDRGHLPETEKAGQVDRIITGFHAGAASGVDKLTPDAATAVHQIFDDVRSRYRR